MKFILLTFISLFTFSGDFASAASPVLLREAGAHLHLRMDFMANGRQIFRECRPERGSRGAVELHCRVIGNPRGYHPQQILKRRNEIRRDNNLRRGVVLSVMIFSAFADYRMASLQNDDTSHLRANGITYIYRGFTSGGMGTIKMLTEGIMVQNRYLTLVENQRTSTPMHIITTKNIMAAMDSLTEVLMGIE